MGLEPAAQRTLRFGEFEADLVAGQLWSQGRRIQLQDQPFQVLAVLLCRPGELITREELHQALWPADTFIEFDQGLNTAIKKIRQSLGDSVDHPRFVETLPRKGYRFIASVSGLDVPTVKPAHRPHPLSVAAALCLIVTAGTAGWMLNRHPGTSAAAFVPIPLTSYPGSESSPSFSPDGSQVVFVWKRPEADHGDLFVRMVSANEPLRLTDDPSTSYGPAWSPDGHKIAFLRRVTGNRTGVFVISPIGGPAQKLAEVDPPTYGSGIAWHPSGRWLVVSHRDSAGEPAGLFSLSVETGEKRRLTLPDQKLGADRDPDLSGGGDAMVFARSPDAIVGVSDLYLLEMSEGCKPKGEAKRITFENRFAADPKWMPDQRTITFCSGAPHNPGLSKIALSPRGWRAGKPERLTFTGEGVRSPTVSRQGRLAYSTGSIDANIWRLELNGGTRATKPPTRLIASTRLDHTPKYSPDGGRIAFASNRSGSHEIWVSNSDGSGVTPLTSFGGSAYTADPSWSPDSRQIYFNSNVEGQPGAYVINSDGGQPKRLSDERPDGWSRDGKWIYFTARGEIWKRPAGGGKAMQVTRKGGTRPQESPDGLFLFYLKGDNEITSLWKVPVGGGEETRALESVCCANFTVVGRGIYFVPKHYGKEHSLVQFLSFATGKVATIATLGGWSACGSSVSPDGHWLLYSQYEPQQGSDIWMVENFR